MYLCFQSVEGCLNLVATQFHISFIAVYPPAYAASVSLMALNVAHCQTLDALLITAALRRHTPPYCAPAYGDACQNN